MICQKCGKENLNNSTFCENCGTNLTQPMPTQPTEQSQYTNNTQLSEKKKNNKIILIIIPIVIIAIVLLLVSKKGKTTKTIDEVGYSPAFFLGNSENKYAVFNDDGKRLTDFVFEGASDFINGAAIVKKDNTYGLVNTNGKMTADFGKYSNISKAAGMFKVRTEEFKYYLINGNGEMLYDLENKNLTTFIAEDSYSILEDNDSKTYKILNYEGKEIVSFPINGSEEKDPETNIKDGYVSVFYNKKNYILDSISKKQIVSFDSDSHYCINDVKEDGKIITLNSCVGMFEKQDKTYYKFIKDGKLYDLTDKCEKVYYADNNLVCSNGYQKNILNSKNELGLDINGKAYTDSNNYAMLKNGSFNGVDFYNNGEVVKNVTCRNLKETGHIDGLYILGTYFSRPCGTESGTYEYYNTKGENAFDKSFKFAEKFNENGLAKVSEDKQNYYLINKDGKKVTDDYSNITLNNEVYIVTKDNLKGLVDETGKELVKCEYTTINIVKKQNKKYAVLTSTDSKYTVYDIEAKKEILKSDTVPSLDVHYLTITKDGLRQYYTYNGKMFYEGK